MDHSSIIKEYLKNIISETIEEISEAGSEGAMLIVVPSTFSNNEDGNIPIDKFLAPMDKEDFQMEWRKKKPIKFLDKTLLRAMMIMDGSTVIIVQPNSGATIEPRFIVYPHDQNGAFATLNIDDCNLDLSILRGKGSRHHGAANFSMLLVSNNKNQSKIFESYLNNNSKELNLPFRIITISADGPVKEWPNEFKKKLS